MIHDRGNDARARGITMMTRLLTLRATKTPTPMPEVIHEKIESENRNLSAADTLF